MVSVAPEVGHVHYLVCLSCRSRLEVTLELGGQLCKCPTCGANFTVPSAEKLEAAGYEPVAVGRVLEERVAPHAYAAAGEMAPEVVEDENGRAVIRCRRCGTMSGIDASACRKCGIPFTIEAGTVEPALRVDGWAVMAVLLGVISLAVYYVPVLSAGAIVCGLVALRRVKVQYSGMQRVLAWSGMALGGLSTAAYVISIIVECR